MRRVRARPYAPPLWLAKWRPLPSTAPIETKANQDESGASHRRRAGRIGWRYVQAEEDTTTTTTTITTRLGLGQVALGAAGCRRLPPVAAGRGRCDASCRQSGLSINRTAGGWLGPAPVVARSQRSPALSHAARRFRVAQVDLFGPGLWGSIGDFCRRRFSSIQTR